MSIVITLNSFSLYQPTFFWWSFSYYCWCRSRKKKDLINYAFCIVEWMRENNWIESCPWIGREREIYAEKPVFCVWGNAIFLHSYAMCFMHENCISSLFLLLFLPICLFALCPWCARLDTHSKYRKKKNCTHIILRQKKNMKLFIRFWVRQKKVEKIPRNRHFQYLMLNTTER